jgi:hypothetical protein
MRCRIGVVLALGAVTWVGAPLPAQTTAAFRAPACTYAECALRFEPGRWGRRLVRGAAGRTVGTFGLFHSSAVDTLLAGPDSAAAYARRYGKVERKATVFQSVASGLVFFGLQRALQASHRNETRAIDWVAIGAGYAAFWPAAHYQASAGSALSRSVWWYNAALVDSMSKR